MLKHKIFHTHVHPLTSSQHEIWFDQMQHEDIPLYNIGGQVHLSGPLNIERFRQAVNLLIQKHDNLRLQLTSNRDEDGSPQQTIVMPFSIAVPLHDFRRESKPQEAAQDWMRQRFIEPFILEGAPLFRYDLVRLADEEYYWLVQYHHLMIDSDGIALLNRSLADIYTCLSHGETPDLDSSSYADFIADDRAYVESPAFDAQRRDWLDKYPAVPEPLLTPRYRSRYNGSFSASGCEVLYMPRDFYSRLRELAERHGVSFVHVLLGALYVYFTRTADRDDCAIGLRLPNRVNARFKQTAGLFATITPVWLNLGRELSFTDLLQGIQESLKNNDRHHNFPLHGIDQTGQAETGRPRLCDVNLAYENHDDDEKFKDLESSFTPMSPLWEQTPLTICVRDFQARAEVEFDFVFNRAYFEAQDIQALQARFMTILEAVLHDSRAPLHALPVMTPAEKNLLMAWNDTATDYPQDKTIVDLFEAQVAKAPDNIAIVFKDQQLTYRQLNEKANQLVHQLRWTMNNAQLSMDSSLFIDNCLIAICVERSLEMVVGLLGILKAGGAYVPIDPNYPKARIQYLLEDSQAQILLTQRHLQGQLPPLAQDCRVVYLDETEFAHQPTTNLDIARKPKDLAYVIYTSGSTGTPKGVMVEHCSLLNSTQVRKNYYGSGSQTRLLLIPSFAFDAFSAGMCNTLSSGGRLYLPESPNDISQLAAIIYNNQINCFIGTPTLYQELLNVMDKPFDTLQDIILGGEVASLGLLQQHFSRLAGAHLFNEYGPTEATIWSTVFQYPIDHKETNIIGRPIANSRIYILDRQHQPQALGIPGELCIAGHGLARGYFKRPELNAEKFIEIELFGKTERIYKTGDLARWLPEGNLEYLGRIDNQIKLRGFRIELGEIENVLSQHSNVAQSVVTCTSSQNGSQRLIAYVIPAFDDTTQYDVVLEESSQTLLSQWQELYDDAYSHISNQTDLTFNISGWTSSYTGKDIAAEEMWVWVETTTASIQALNPRDVLEIGCGSGLLLYRIAPQASTYRATDFSATTLQKLGKLKQKYPELSHVELQHRTADNFDGIQSEQFDTVIINSVIQYFPGVEYLIHVLEQAINALKPGGYLFIGDVRHLPLLRTFHASVQAFQAGDEVSQATLRQMVAQHQLNDKELVIDPRLFIALYQQHPRVTGVKILPHRGMIRNELSCFRYQVVLEIEHPEKSNSATHWQDWHPSLTLESLRKKLEEDAEILALRNIANARLASDNAIVAWLDDDMATEKTLGELRRTLATTAFNGLEPEALWQLGEQLGYQVELSWQSADAEGHFDVLFVPKTMAYRQVALPIPTISFKTWHDFANNPLQRQLNEKLIPQLRDYLQDKLPDYMIPSAFVLLDKFPLTPNGKINHKALPDPESIIQSGANEYIAPRNDTETQLAQIWMTVLGLEHIGIYDNFFALGGHSLLATQVVSQVRKAFEVALPLHELFNSPTIAELSHYLQCSERSAQCVLPEISPDTVARHEPFPLNEVQQAYWLGRSDAFAMGNVAPHGYSETDCPVFDVPRLEQAWQRLIEHHEMLRAVVLADGNQRILQQVPAYRIQVLDLSDESCAARQTKLMEIRRSMSDHVFDVERWPLFDIRVTRIDAETMRLHFSIDILIADGWSITALDREWWKLYQNPALELQSLSLSFRDYILAEQTWQHLEIYQAALRYWRGRLDSLPPAPQLPLARQPETLKRPHFTSRGFRLDTTQQQRLGEQAAKAGVTPSVLLLTAFSDILSIWSKSAHLTLNLTLFNRLPVHEQINRVVGDFTSLVLLEIDNRQALTFEQRVRRVQQQLWQDLEHRYVSGIHVMRELSSHNKDRATAMPVVFTSVLALDIAQDDSVTESLGKPVFWLGSTPQVWIDNIVREDKNGLILAWQTVDDLFYTGMLDDMFAAYRRHIERLLEDAAAWQDTRLSPLLPDAHLALQNAANATQAPESPLFMHELFVEQAAKQPAQLALVCGEVCLNYGELHAAALSLGQWLRQHHAGRNQFVAVVMDKGWEQVVAVLGILYAGAAYVPIDPELPEQRQHFLLAETETKVVLTQGRWLDSLNIPADIHLLALDQAELPPCSELPPVPGRERGDLAYIIYTSGSTGNPKGVVIDHRGAVNTLVDVNRRFQVSAQDRVLALSALNFDLSVYDIFGILGAGGAMVIPEPARRRDPGHWAELMREHQVTFWNTVPALMQMLVDYQNGAPLATPLRVVMMSGDWIPLDLPERIRQLWPACQVYSFGGATEASIWSIYYPIEQVDPEWHSIPYGKALDNQSFYVLDERLEPCPIWTPGQLYIGGIGLALGYWKDAAKTSAAFITHPHSGERLYKTGDIGRWLPDGNIEFLGREDAQIKIRGHRIELGEIEIYLNRYPGIKEAVVTAVGEASQEKQLVAYIVPQKASVDAEDYGMEAMKGSLVEPAERATFKLSHPGIRQFDDARDGLALPAVELNQNAYLARQSYRRFEETPLPLTALSALLAALQAMTFPQALLPKYRYGSAGSLYPVQCYLYVKCNRVTGLEGGLYYYHPLEHRLILLTDQPTLSQDLHGGINRKIFAESAFSLFLISQMQAIEPMYGQMSRDFCLLEAGYMSQLLMEESHHHDIGLCPIGGMQFEPIRCHFELGEDQELLHSFMGGAITLEQKTTLPAPESSVSKHKEEIKTFLRNYLPGYMVPNHYVTLEELPLSANGKVDKKALPPPDFKQAAKIQGLPANETEQQLLECVMAILKTEAFDVTDNFFDIGINSLDFIQIFTAIKQQWNVEIGLMDLYRLACVRKIAALLESKLNTEEDGFEEIEL